MYINQKEEVEAVMRGLKDSHTILSNLLGGIPVKSLSQKRGDGFWSIAEHAAHLADVQPMLAERIKRILKEDTPEFVPFIPSEDETVKAAEIPAVEQVLADFKKGRDAIVEKLSMATPEDWQRLAVHPEYQQYGLLVIARHILMHDHWHMYRMEELWLTRDAYLTRMEG